LPEDGFAAFVVGKPKQKRLISKIGTICLLKNPPKIPLKELIIFWLICITVCDRITGNTLHRYSRYPYGVGKKSSKNVQVDLLRFYNKTFGM
jgi:hypothetical protein